jgi:hypothetical protein
LRSPAKFKSAPWTPEAVSDAKTVQDAVRAALANSHSQPQSAAAAAGATSTLATDLNSWPPGGGHIVKGANITVGGKSSNRPVGLGVF